MSEADDERWHVRMGPGEVKLLTLEQIDDLFRLDMIDGETLLRQEGTAEWLPLRVVAGLDDDDPAEPAAATSSSAPPSSSAASTVRTGATAPPPPPPPLPPPSAANPAPFTHSPSFVPPAVRSAPPPRAVPSAPPPVRSAPPPPLVPSAPPPIASVAPLSFASPPRPQRTSRADWLLVGLVALLGLLVTLHRNGALAALSASAGQSAAYQSFEAALGGPGFGTPRAVEALVGSPASSARAE